MARLHPLVVVALLATAVHAQSKRYPAPPKDADKDAETHSHLWESALDPERKPYDELVRDANRLLDDRAPTATEAARLAVTKLDEAIQRLPKDYRAHELRGFAYLVLGDWQKCASDLELADHNEFSEAVERDQVQLRLGICQGRAGRFADAERTLLHAVTVAPRAEQWMRLGEVRIALGKLDEAVDALTAGLEAHDGSEGTIRWLLALAYDRARKASASDDEAHQAIKFDAAFNLIQNPVYPWLRPGETDYLFGLAYRAQPELDRDRATPEIALLYFRHFLKVAPDSPWRRRAEEHVRELAGMTFPASLARTQQSSSPVDTATLLPIVQKTMPALRACLVKLPATAFTITIVKVGAHDTSPEHAHYVLPPPSVKVVLARQLEAGEAGAEDAARRCLQSLADRIALPAPKDHDTYYQVSFVVVAP